MKFKILQVSQHADGSIIVRAQGITSDGSLFGNDPLNSAFILFLKPEAAKSYKVGDVVSLSLSA